MAAEVRPTEETSSEVASQTAENSLVLAKLASRIANEFGDTSPAYRIATADAFAAVNSSSKNDI